jgi:polyhydroxyalkanoate synthesis regulator phasin
MMHFNEMLKQMLDFNKKAYESGLKNLSMCQEQMEKMIDLYIDQTVVMPEQGKKAAKELASMYKKGFDDFKTLMDTYYSNLGKIFQEKTHKPNE